MQEGKPVGLINAKCVKTSLIALPNNPEDFHSPLPPASQLQSTGVVASDANMFSYEYYERFRERFAFLNKSIKARNAAVEHYNEKVKQFDKARAKFNELVRQHNAMPAGVYRKQMLQEVEQERANMAHRQAKIHEESTKLQSWRNNLNALREELGTEYSSNDSHRVDSLIVNWPPAAPALRSAL